MPCVHTKFGGCKTTISFVGEYKVGDQPPEGYSDWHAWAEVQHKGGLRQLRCVHCGKYRYPQESCCGEKMADQWSPCVVFNADGWFVLVYPAVKFHGPYESEGMANRRLKQLRAQRKVKQ